MRSAKLALPLLIALGSAGVGAWWLRRGPAPVSQVRAALRPAAPPGERASPRSRGAPRASEANPSVEQAAAGGKDEAPVTAGAAPDGPPALEDRELGRPQVPSPFMPSARVADPPAVSPLDDDESAPDDPRDFDLPASDGVRP